jgi:hypothetical protein
MYTEDNDDDAEIAEKRKWNKNSRKIFKEYQKGTEHLVP